MTGGKKGTNRPIVDISVGVPGSMLVLGCGKRPLTEKCSELRKLTVKQKDRVALRHKDKGYYVGSVGEAGSVS